MKELNPRYFNKLEMLGTDPPMIRKSSKDIHKICAEFRWLSFDISAITFNHPVASNLQIGSEIASYDIEFIEGKTLADIFLSEQGLVPDEFGAIFNHVFKLLKSGICIDIDNSLIVACNTLFSKKTRERIEKTGLNLDVNYVLNGKEMPTIRQLMDTIQNVYSNDSFIGATHGDMCFSNMILTDGLDEKDLSESLFFIDPRGFLDKKEKYTCYGDIRYDVAKLGHSVIGRYDQIIAGTMQAIELSPNNIVLLFDDTPYKREVEQVFLDVFVYSDGNFLKYTTLMKMMIHLFLSMIPLHKDNDTRQLTMLANAYRLYDILDSSDRAYYI